MSSSSDGDLRRLVELMEGLDRRSRADAALNESRIKNLQDSLDQRMRTDQALNESRYLEIRNVLKSMEGRISTQQQAARPSTASHLNNTGTFGRAAPPPPAGVPAGGVRGGGVRRHIPGDGGGVAGGHEWISAPALSSILELPADFYDRPATAKPASAPKLIPKSHTSSHTSSLSPAPPSKKGAVGLGDPHAERASAVLPGDGVVVVVDPVAGKKKGNWGSQKLAGWSGPIAHKAQQIPLMVLMAFRYNSKEGEERHPAVQKTIEVTKHIFWDVWDPITPSRRFWDSVILCCMVYILLCTPYIIAFNINMLDTRSSIVVVDIVVVTLFLIDILLNFKTSFIGRKGNFIRDRSRIAIHYLSFWFWLDLVTALPWIWMAAASSLGPVQAARVVIFFRLFRVIIMLRLLKELNKHNTNDVFEYIERWMGKSLFSVLKIVFVSIILLHWTACSWYFCASWSNFDKDSWVYEQNLVPNAKDDYHEASYFTKYIFSLYWASGTLAGVGYGDIVAGPVDEKLVAMFFIFSGALMFAYITGSIISMINNTDPARQHILQKMSYVDNFIGKRKVPDYLASRVRRYYNFTVRREYLAEESAVIDGLPPRLQTQVVLQLNQDFIRSVPMFEGKTVQFIFAIVKRLKLDFALPGDAVAWQGSVLHSMYFIREGTVEVRLYSQQVSKMSRMVVTHQNNNKSGRGSGAHKDNEDSDDDSVNEIESARDRVLVLLGKLGWKRAFRLRRTRRIAPGLVDFDPSQRGGGGGSGADSADPSQTVVQLTKSPEELTKSRSTLLGTLSHGDQFGGTSCFQSVPCPATAVAKTECELHALTALDIDQVADEFPELTAEIKSLGFICRLTEVVATAVEAAREQAAARELAEAEVASHKADDGDSRPQTPSPTSVGGGGLNLFGTFRTPSRQPLL